MKTKVVKPLKRHLITIYPDMKFGYPTIDHHRIEAMQFADIWWGGNMDLKDIQGNWPGINRGAVLVCCWYAARYGTRLWRKRWGYDGWLKTAESFLWHDDYRNCPLPPQKPKP